jgi:hypothetical protein
MDRCIQIKCRRTGGEGGGVFAKVLAALAVLCILAIGAWIMFLPRLVVAVVESRTGFRATVEKMAVNPFAGSVEIRGLTLQNPDGWPAEGFVELRELRANAKVMALLRGRFEADEVVVDIARVTLVRGEQGELNAVAFKNSAAGAEAVPDKKAAPPKDADESSGFHIARLTMRFDQLVYADFSGRRPSEKRYDLRIDREMRDVDTVAELLSPFSGAAASVLLDAIPGVSGEKQDLLKSAAEALKESGNKAGEVVKGMLNSLEKLKPKK